MAQWHLSEDRLFDPNPAQRKLARELYQGIADLPIVCPHGHVDPRWLAENTFDAPGAPVTPSELRPARRMAAGQRELAGRPCAARLDR